MIRNPQAIEAQNANRQFSGKHAKKAAAKSVEQLRRRQAEARIDAVLDAITFPEDEL